MFNFDDAEIDVTKEEILSKVSQLDIFKKYCKNFEELDKSFKSEFYYDTNPSCRIYINQNNSPCYKDFGTGEFYDCFSYVQKKFSVNFHESLRIIATDFNINQLKISFNPQFRSLLMLNDPIDVKPYPKAKSKIEIYPQNYSLTDYNYWSQYKIPFQLLEDYDVFACKYVYLYKADKTTIFEYKKSNPIYGYRFTNDGKYSYKIYFPLAEKKYKWLFSGGSANDIEGYDQLDFHGDTLILTKSLKDCMCYRLFGINAISLQGEANKVPEGLFDKLLKRYNTIIVNYDNDEQGIKSAKALCQKYNLESFVFDKAKDLSDLIKEHGIDEAINQLEEKLKTKIIINKKYE